MKSNLRDVQNLIDKRGIEIQKVGIKNVDVPLIIQRKGTENQVVSARAKISASLDSCHKGTHMSRFISTNGAKKSCSEWILKAVWKL